MSEEKEISQDLTTEVDDTTLDDAVVEFTTREEIINCSVAALYAVADFDPMTSAGISRKKRIVFKCLRMLDDMVGEMYDEFYNPDEDDSE